MHGQIDCKQGAWGNLGGGERKGPWPSVEGDSSNLILIGQILVTGWPLFWYWNQTPPNNEQAIWSRKPLSKKKKR